MDFQYSELIDPSLYDAQGLCDGIPLRRHKDPMREDIGSIRAQEDWAKLVAPTGFYRGGLGPEYSFMRVAVPECLPERLEVISYANEYAFLYDDIMETLSDEATNSSRKDLLDVFLKDLLSDGQNVTTRGEKKIQLQILAEMMAIDSERAMTTMKAWATFIRLASNRPRSAPFASLEEFIPYRIIDAGESIWFGTVTFGMALTIPDEEMALCKELVRPAFAAWSLTNDLFSWDKEHQAAQHAGDSEVVNAVWVLMREHSVDESRAKEICREKIKEKVIEYLRIVDDTKRSPSISADLIKYVEAIQYSLSGNVAWSIHCPRYHAEATYSQQQQMMMKHGSGTLAVQSS
ncbi:hypothetical protein MMC07_000054 [Pseudocyphellaria aurata]|nr:hypothetical protein [Pseudocyphellaria aurata]